MGQSAFGNGVEVFLGQTATSGTKASLAPNFAEGSPTADTAAGLPFFSVLEAK